MIVESIVSNINVFIAAIGLVILSMETIIPGGQFMIPGVSLTLSGLTGVLFGLNPLALSIFVVVYGAIAFLGYKKLDIYGGSGQEQTTDASSLEGKTGYVIDTVTKTDGRVKLDNGGFSSTFSARSELDTVIEEGKEVVVTNPGGGNVVTVVEKSTDVEDIDRELSKSTAHTEQSTEESEQEVETN